MGVQWGRAQPVGRRLEKGAPGGGGELIASAHMASLRLICVVVALGGACSQPTGVVISVEGAESASQLWLAVGVAAKDGGGKRFLQTDETDFIEHEPPFEDGFEIFLDRDKLMGQGKIALVLDSTVPMAPLDIQRDSYVLTPESGVLTEVKLAPKGIGSGQWVCAGQPRTGAQAGFAVALDESDQDCDRDGWHFGTSGNVDPDDADPLQVGTPAWTQEGLRCLLKLGDRKLYDPPLGSCAAPCITDPLDGPRLEGCFQEVPKVRCEIELKGRESRGIFTVQALVKAQINNPNWELVKLGPQGAKAYFAPSDRSPNEWSVIFEMGEIQLGWFLLTDRDSGLRRLIRVEAKSGTDSSCRTEAVIAAAG